MGYWQGGSNATAMTSTFASSEMGQIRNSIFGTITEIKTKFFYTC